MSIELLRKSLSADRASFIEPCLPSPADKPPSGSNWIHEIKHDGYRLMGHEAACKRWPGETITLRQGARVIEDSRKIGFV